MAVRFRINFKNSRRRSTTVKQRTETVRTLFSWFGFEGHGYGEVRQIRKALKQVKLRTEPDFEGAWIGAGDFVYALTQPAPNLGEQKVTARVL